MPDFQNQLYPESRDTYTKNEVDALISAGGGGAQFTLLPEGETLNLFVATNGNDANDGLTLITPLATIAAAFSLLQNKYITYGVVTINLADGTYNDELVIANGNGDGSIFIAGNPGDPNAVKFNCHVTLEGPGARNIYFYYIRGLIDNQFVGKFGAIFGVSDCVCVSGSFIEVQTGAVCLVGQNIQVYSDPCAYIFKAITGGQIINIGTNGPASISFNSFTGGTQFLQGMFVLSGRSAVHLPDLEISLNGKTITGPAYDVSQQSYLDVGDAAPPGDAGTVDASSFLSFTP